MFEFEDEIDDKKKIYDENMLMKIRIVCQEINFFRRKTFKIFFLNNLLVFLRVKSEKKLICRQLKTFETIIISMR